MLKKLLLVFYLITIAFAGCKNDLEINAPYKEMPSVYALISPNEKTHVIRINKVFLGEGDANVMAKVADSINYPQGELEVSLSRFINDVQVNASPNKRIVYFTDENTVTAEEGAFNTSQRV